MTLSNADGIELSVWDNGVGLTDPHRAAWGRGSFSFSRSSSKANSRTSRSIPDYASECVRILPR